MTRKTLTLKKKAEPIETTEQAKPIETTEQAKPEKTTEQAKPKKQPKPKKEPPPPTPKSKYPPALKKALALLSNLEENHPALFPADGTSPKPWAIGIHKAIQARYGVSGRVAKIALTIWQKRNKRTYRAALKTGNPRYDLDGNEAGEVLESEIPPG